MKMKQIKSQLAHYNAAIFVLNKKLEHESDIDKFIKISSRIDALELKIECLNMRINVKRSNAPIFSKLKELKELKQLNVQI